MSDARQPRPKRPKHPGSSRPGPGAAGGGDARGANKGGANKAGRKGNKPPRPVTEAPVRTCIITRQAHEAEELLRLVVSPEGTVEVEARGKLPGRGAWIQATRETLALAEARPAVVRRALDAPEAQIHDLPGRALALTERAVLDLLSLAARAGLLITGADAVEDARKRAAVVAILFASDTSSSTESGVRGDSAVPSWRLPWDANSLGARIGKGARAVLGLRSGSVAPELLRQLRRMEKLR